MLNQVHDISFYSIDDRSGTGLGYGIVVDNVFSCIIIEFIIKTVFGMGLMNRCNDGFIRLYSGWV